MANLLNLIPNALPQDPQHPAMYGYVSTTQPVPTSFSQPLYVVIPDWTNEFYWPITDWPACHGSTLPTAGAACALVRDNRNVLRCLWWDATTTAFSPTGAAGGDLAGTYPNPTLSGAIAQSASVNQAGQTMKGTANIATSETRTNTRYGTMPTPDQVTGIVLPTNGLIAVWYQATWQESISAAASAAIFLGTSQVQVAGNATTIVQPAGIGGTAAKNVPLATAGGGLQSPPGGAADYSGDVLTGQIIDQAGASNSGPCYIFASAGTYTVSIQFKSTSGSVTATNRKLWVEAKSFA